MSKRTPGSRRKSPTQSAAKTASDQAATGDGPYTSPTETGSEDVERKVLWISPQEANPPERNPIALLLFAVALAAWISLLAIVAWIR